MLSSLQCSADDVVLDPFAGASTTLIECHLNNIDCFGFEINPFLQFVGSTCLKWGIGSSALASDLGELEERFHARSFIKTIDQAVESGLKIPPIHNVFRWWRADVLLDLMKLKAAVSELGSESSREFFKLALAGVLVPDLTNVTLGRLQLHFVDKSEVDIQVWKTFALHASSMISDVAALEQEDIKAKCRVYLQDATNLTGFEEAAKASVVITSPPYPNRYSYVWNTRPHLYMLDLISKGHEASQIDKRTIGGTWGTATSELAKGVITPINDAVGRATFDLVREIREKDNLMANYVIHYFNRLAAQIVEMEQVITPSARVAYVVGNSRIKDCYVATDTILAEIFRALGLGYDVTEVHRFRKRNSGVNLFESIVYAWKR